MSETGAALAAAGVFAIALVALAWLSVQISLQMQQVVYNITRSVDWAVVVYFLLMLPGIVAHEAAHWVVAWLLGLKPGRFTVWPRRRGRMVGLGSVTARDGGALRNSLVGMAPLLIGTLLVALLARGWFGGPALPQMAGAEPALEGAAHGLRLWWLSLLAAFRRPDAALWAYLIFAVANGMMPSAPDREPLKPVLTYAALAALAYVALGMPLSLLGDALEAVQRPLLHLNSALLVTVALDVGVLLALWGLAAVTALRPLPVSTSRRR